MQDINYRTLLNATVVKLSSQNLNLLIVSDPVPDKAVDQARYFGPTFRLRA